MKRMWCLVLLGGMMLAGPVVRPGMAQGHRSGRMGIVGNRAEVQGGDSGNEIATVVPYMVLMAVFLGCGIYSFVANRSSTP